jgi:hypothetical protein
LFIAILIFFLGRCTAPKPVITGSITKHTVDTVYQVTQLSPDTVIHTATITQRLPYFIPVHDTNNIILRDTLKQGSPCDSSFVVSDSVINKKNDTTFHLVYFPALKSVWTTKYGKDTSKIIHDNMSTTNTVEQKEPWYIKPLVFAGGGLLGYLVGRIK